MEALSSDLQAKTGQLAAATEDLEVNDIRAGGSRFGAHFFFRESVVSCVIEGPCPFYAL